MQGKTQKWILNSIVKHTTKFSTTWKSLGTTVDLKAKSSMKQICIKANRLFGRRIKSIKAGCEQRHAMLEESIIIGGTDDNLHCRH
tara:strand:+ start:7616 stop:7873 length:258 start_codon:yes stop_codon:yes gene_type:complete